MDFLEDMSEDIFYLIQYMCESPQIIICIIALTLVAITIRIRFFNIQNFGAAKQQSGTMMAEKNAGKVQQIAENRNDTPESDYIEEVNEIYRRLPVRVSLKNFDWDQVSDSVFDRSTVIADYSNSERNFSQDDSETDSE